jgi:hypothetical protein
VPIGIGGIEGNIERVPTLMNAELKHALPVPEFFCLRTRRQTLPVLLSALFQLLPVGSPRIYRANFA